MPIQPCANSTGIPSTILDSALQWAVVLGSGEVQRDQRLSFNQWLIDDPLHSLAWQRIQMIEQDFSTLRQLSDDHSSAKNPPKKRQFLKLLSAVVACVMVLTIAIEGRVNLHAWRSAYATTLGQVQHIQLAGGTKISLDSLSAINIDSSSSAPIITLLSGSIFIDSSAASSSKKPTIVTNDASFTPIGTQFIVNSNSKQSSLQVLAGQVKIAAKDFQLKVLEGNSWSINDGIATPMINSGIKAGGWRQGVIEANNARLAEVLQALQPYHRGKIYYTSDVANLRVTGTFRLEDTNSALLVISAALPIDITSYTQWWTHITLNK